MYSTVKNQEQMEKASICKKSYTKADLFTEGKGPVCRVPIPTLTHFPLVISTVTPVAVWYD